jgi:hypothetical protein
MNILEWIYPMSSEIMTHAVRRNHPGDLEKPALRRREYRCAYRSRHSLPPEIVPEGLHAYLYRRNSFNDDEWARHLSDSLSEGGLFYEYVEELLRLE